MPQITAYATKADLERWKGLENKAAAIRWLLDKYEAGEVELPTKQSKPPQTPTEKQLREMPVIKTPQDAKRAVEPLTDPHKTFFKPKKAKNARRSV